MASGRDYDVAVIGGGPGGYTAAIRASQRGADTCVVEKGQLGGVCTNEGCIPTKALVESTRRLFQCRENEEFGIVCGDPEVDFGQAAARRDEVVSRLRKGVSGLLKANSVSLERGHAIFEDAHTLRIESDSEERRISAENIIVATGSSSAELPVVEPDGETVMTSGHAVALDELPESIIIVGGGYIGCEFANLFGALGVKVKVVEMLESLLPGMDKDLSATVQKNLDSMGVTLYTSTSLDECDVTTGKVTARLSDGDELVAEKMLVAVGRQPNCTGLGLDETGLEAEKDGALAVNEHMQTAVDNIYAIGDVTGDYMLAHAASYEAKVAAEHATGELSAAADHRVMPACVFTSPEIATVGLTESQAKDEGVDVTISKFPLRALGKAHVEGDTSGYAKMIADERTKEVLGVHIVAPDASALIGEAALGMKLEVTARELAETIHPHPTMCEALHEAGEGVMGLPINWTG